MVTSGDLWASTNRPLWFETEVSLPLKGHLIYGILLIRSSQCYLYTLAYYGDQGDHKCSAEKATPNPEPDSNFNQKSFRLHLESDVHPAQILSSQDSSWEQSVYQPHPEKINTTHSHTPLGVKRAIWLFNTRQGPTLRYLGVGMVSDQ